MRKRRVLALLLALSLTVSVNGMTVLATEAGDAQALAVSAAEGTADGTSEETEQTDTAEDDGASGDTDSEDAGKDKEGQGGAKTDDSASNEDSSQGVTDADDSANQEENSGEAASGEQKPDGEKADETDTDGDNSDGQKPDETIPGGTISGNDVAGEESAAPETEEQPDAAEREVRLMTFTDDTGFKIIYDANAAEDYVYTVENGILTKVETATVSEGGTTTSPVTFRGNVELTQPKEGQPYESISAALFTGNTAITYVKLPAGVTSIAADTFKGCTALKGVYLPATVASIGTSAFENCTAMTQIALPKAVTAIGNSAFKGDAKLYMMYMKDVDYSELTSIGDSAFEGCSALAEFCSDTEFFLPARLKRIGENAFRECKSIEKVDLNTAELETMGESAFRDCTGLTDAVICKTLKTIPAYAFDGCGALELVTFSIKERVTIGEYAFYNCYRLKELELPATIDKVSNYAFAGCTNLSVVTAKNPTMLLGESAPFPAGQTNGCLVFVGQKYLNDPDQTALYAYSLQFDAKKVTFIDPDEDNSKKFYTYKVVDNKGVECQDGKLPGGQIWVGTADENHSDKNINTLNNGNGVPSDNSKKYYVYYQADTGYSLVTDSIKANGKILQKDKTGYWFTMPFGGAVITAEFCKTGSVDTIEGVERDVTVEFSNGESIAEGSGVELKIGQTTRMFLLDKSGKPISSAKIKKIESSKSNIAKVSDSGVITAVGEGTASITVTLIGEDGSSFLVRRTIRVVKADVALIRLEASKYSSNIQVTGSIDGIQTASVSKNYVRDGLKITLTAHAYTEDKERVGKELTWKSSDTSIVSLQKSSTTSADSSNVAEIRPMCEGEATITVSAKINSKKTVTQKFVVSVQNQKARLASSSITVNPNLKECGELEIISSYGGSLPSDGNPPKIIEKMGNNWVDSGDFRLKAKAQSGSNTGSSRYSIMLTDNDIAAKSYKVYVCFDETAKDESLPLTITVKRSVPSPTVKFNTKKTKFNLFYKNGGTDQDGNPITVTTEVTKLGSVKVEKFELCALTEDKEDDQKFLANFEIVNDPADLAKNMVTIKRKSGNLQYTEGNNPKAVVSGYLKIYYEGYRDEVAKKVKVTMPTVTTAPSYVLDRTSVTYRDTALKQSETLTLLEKKTKKPVALDPRVMVLRMESDETIVDQRSVKIDEEGKIAFDVSYMSKDTLRILLTNPTEWDTDKNGKARELTYKFNVKVTDKEPTIKTDQTVTLNTNYPETEGTFGLTSDQKDTVLASTQEFDYNRKARNAAEFDKLDVSYQNGKGTVKIKPGEKIKTGTYKWTCNALEKGAAEGEEFKKATTLTVKVVDTKPTVKLGKGSLVLNLATKTVTDGVTSYDEVSEIPLKITGKPDEYALDTKINTGENSTKIECTTKNESGAENKFDWTVEDSRTENGTAVDGKLTVSIKDTAPAKKTYTFKMTARYVQQNPSVGAPNVVEAKPLTFKVKVDNNNSISVSFSAKGKLNLVDREGEYTTKNTIVYTPSLKNVRGKITNAWIYDADTNEESKYFDLYLNKADGKLYVTPKKTAVNSGGGAGDDTGGGTTETPGTGDDIGGGTTPENPDAGGDTGGGTTPENPDAGGDTGGGTTPENPDTGDDTGGGTTETPGTGDTGGGTTETPGTGDAGGGTGENGAESGGIAQQADVVQEWQYAELENNKQYRVKIEVKVEGYRSKQSEPFHNGIVSKPIKIKTAQTLPKVTTDKSTVDVYLSNKEYDASFVVTPQAGAAGIVEDIKFHDDDEVPRDAFEILYEKQADGSLKVILHLKQAVAYKCDSTNKVKMYITFKGQGTNTTGTALTMSIRVNK